MPFCVVDFLLTAFIVAAKGYGYFEDRRPASNADPYRISNAIMVSCYGDAE